MSETGLPAAAQVMSGEVAVGFGDGEQRGRIMVVLAPGEQWVAMDPAQAVAVAKDMIDKAVVLGANVQILVPRKEISKAKLSMLVNRVSLVMRNLLEKKRDPQYVAEEVVQIVLRDSQ